MAESAFQIQYRQSFVDTFEQRQSLMRDTTTTEAVIKGNQATFLVAGSGGATAVTRGLNGLIPGRADDLTQVTATLTEWHDKPIKTGFNIFASQGNQVALMQLTCMSVINRKIDSQIIVELNTATNDTGAAATASLAMATKAMTILGNNDVQFDGNIYAAITPGFLAYLHQVKEFGNADYVAAKPLDSGAVSWADRQGYWDWLGIKWFVHPNLPGKATSSEKCFMYHKSAIAHAADVGGMSNVVGYDEEDDYSFARCSMFMGAKLLQNSGVVVMNHDSSALVAS